jgi:hypothetical protein
MTRRGPSDALCDRTLARTPAPETVAATGRPVDTPGTLPLGDMTYGNLTRRQAG